MILYNGVDVSNEAIRKNLIRLTNQIYKLLPAREEEGDWITPLENITEEIAGFMITAPNFQSLLLKLNNKLEGLISLSAEDKFLQYRRVIFDCLSIMNELVSLCEI